MSENDLDTCSFLFLSIVSCSLAIDLLHDNALQISRRPVLSYSSDSMECNGCVLVGLVSST